jgi:GrpB-like predicted nucleotidyltransferase (UPF0157 family)
VKSGADVEIADYSEQWPLMFAAESELIRRAFEPHSVTVEHIGSTAVPGMSAKPVVDILLGATSLETIEAQIVALESCGYRYVAEFEKQLPQRRYFVKPLEGEAQFHLHAVESASQFWCDHVAFRDILRINRQVFDAYLSLKRNLAESMKMSRDAYTQAKGPFIEAVVNGQARRA